MQKLIHLLIKKSKVKVKNQVQEAEKNKDCLMMRIAMINQKRKKVKIKSKNEVYPNAVGCHDNNDGDDERGKPEAKNFPHRNCR